MNEREFLREKRRAKRARQVFVQKIILASMCLVLTFGTIFSVSFFASNAKENEIQVVELIWEPIPEEELIVEAETKASVEAIAVEPELRFVEEEVLSTQQAPSNIYNVSEADILLFKQIIAAESYSFWTKEECLALASVVINRYNSPTFPESSSIRECLTAKSQFETYSNGRYLEAEITEDVNDAVNEALAGKTNLNSNIMYFCTSEFYSTCPRDNFFVKDLNAPVHKVRNVLFFEEP